MLTLVTEFGKFIEQTIYARGETFEQFGLQVKTSRTTVANWVTHDAQPRRKVCYRIATLLNMPVEEILEMAGHIVDTSATDDEVGRKIGAAHVRPGTPLTRQQLADAIAELERVFAETLPVIREAISREDLGQE